MSVVEPKSWLRGACAALLLLSTACAERTSPLSPTDTPPTADPSPAPLVAIACRGDVRSGTFECSSPETQGIGANLIIGGQNQYVRLESSNLQVSGTTLTIDVTVTNLIPQPLGTVDGTTLHPAGVRVFFAAGPSVTVGTGAVSVTGDGIATFTASDQVYYQWSEVLAHNATSAARTWTFTMGPDVDAFQFLVYVAAEVQFPDGWVDIGVTGDLVGFPGGSAQLTGVVRSAVGNVVDEPVTWASTNEHVATINAGEVSRVHPGSAAILATAGPRSGAVTVRVCPNLAVGAVYEATMPDAAVLCLGGYAESSEFTVIPVNVGPAPAQISVLATGTLGVTGPPTPYIVGAGAGAPTGLGGLATLPFASPTETGADRGDGRVRAGARGPGMPNSVASAVIEPGVPTVGDLWSLNVADGCTATPDMRDARVVAVRPNVIVVADEFNPSGGFTPEEYGSIAAELDTIAYPVVTANFGAPVDRDANGRVVAFFTRAVNELTPPGASSIVTGRFRVQDARSPVDCAGSNNGELIYLIVPDPTGEVNGNARSVNYSRGAASLAFTGELQRLINANRRIHVRGAPLEEPWLDAALSAVAAELVFYGSSVGLAPGMNINLAALTSGPHASQRVTAFNLYANPNFIRFRTFLQRPDTVGAFTATGGVGNVGVLWGFLRYAADRAGGAQPAFWQSLTDTDLVGMANLQNVTGAALHEWYADFLAATYADDAVAGVAPRFTQPSWNFRSVYSGLGVFPLLARPLTAGVGLALTYQGGGGTAFLRHGVAASTFATVEMTAAGGGPPTSDVLVRVIRTK